MCYFQEAVLQRCGQMLVYGLCHFRCQLIKMADRRRLLQRRCTLEVLAAAFLSGRDVPQQPEHGSCPHLPSHIWGHRYLPCMASSICLEIQADWWNWAQSDGLTFFPFIFTSRRCWNISIIYIIYHKWLFRWTVSSGTLPPKEEAWEFQFPFSFFKQSVYVQTKQISNHSRKHTIIFG